MFCQITDLEPPATPISAETYTKYGYPWFRLYDEFMPDIEAPEVLAKVKTVHEVEQKEGAGGEMDDSVEVDKEQVLGIKLN